MRAFDKTTPIFVKGKVSITLTLLTNQANFSQLDAQLVG